MAKYSNIKHKINSKLIFPSHPGFVREECKKRSLDCFVDFLASVKRLFLAADKLGNEQSSILYDGNSKLYFSLGNG